MGKVTWGQGNACTAREVTWGHGDKGEIRIEGTRGQGDMGTRGLRLKNQFLTTGKIAGYAVAHEFIA